MMMMRYNLYPHPEMVLLPLVQRLHPELVLLPLVQRLHPELVLVQ
jgi:hypothetical protein